MRLIIEDDSGRRMVVPFTADELSIGRERGNGLRLTERNVSRRHAILTRHDGGVIIEDLGSSNGVRINGDRIQGKRAFGEGDIVQIGDYDLALEDETKAGLPERPTQPELASNPAGRGSDAGDATDDLGDELQALARMQRAAALQAALSKGKRRAEHDTDPKRGAVSADTPWPPDFHRFEPGAIAAAVASLRRRRILLALLSAGAIAGAVVFILRSRAAPPRATGEASSAVAAAVAAPLAAPVEAPPAAPGPAQVLAPLPSAPQPIAPPAAVRPATPLARPAAASASVVAPAANAHASRVAAREKAHDLYQDAVADVSNGDYPGAMSKLQEALRVDPSLPEVHKELAICYSHLNQPDKGALHYEKYLELAPQASDANDVRQMLRDYAAAKGR